MKTAPSTGNSTGFDQSRDHPANHGQHQAATREATQAQITCTGPLVLNKPRFNSVQK